MGGIGYGAHLRYHPHDTVEADDTFVSDSAIRTAVDEGRHDVEDPLPTSPAHPAAARETGLRLTRDQVATRRMTRAAFDETRLAIGSPDVWWVAGTEVARENWRMRTR